MKRLNEYQHGMIRHGVTTLFQTTSLFWLMEGRQIRQVASISRMTNNTSNLPVSVRATSRISLTMSDLSQLSVTLIRVIRYLGSAAAMPSAVRWLERIYPSSCSLPILHLTGGTSHAHPS